MPKHNQKITMPIQPIQEDENGIMRFIPNRIVELLLDSGQIDLNGIDCMDFTDQERMQFAQLIGYSLCGFGELHYINDETYDAAEIMAKGGDKSESRNLALRNQLDAVKKGIKEATVTLFKIHPDALVS